jgi:hypothetical protein
MSAISIRCAADRGEPARCQLFFCRRSPDGERALIDGEGHDHDQTRNDGRREQLADRLLSDDAVK